MPMVNGKVYGAHTYGLGDREYTLMILEGFMLGFR